MFAFARPRRVAWCVVLCAALIELVPPPPQAAASTCTFDSGSAKASVSIGSGTGTLSVGSGGEILLDTVQCDTATVSNADTIDVQAIGGTIVIDLSGGPFAPGKTAETSGQSEIEFTGNLISGTLEIDGTSGNDDIALGAGGVNLNGAEGIDDADVMLSNVAVFLLNGGDGNDVLTANGGQGTGTTLITAVTISGGTGNDRIAGSAATDVLSAGTGNDTVDFSSAPTGVYVWSLPNTTVTSSIGSDVLHGVENVIGSSSGDYLYGGKGRNVLRGGGGLDTFRGGPGNDVLIGGPGEDKVDYSLVKQRIVANLARGRARGEGHDRLRGIEFAIGTRFADRITGTRRTNWIWGGAGPDTIAVGGGSDTVYAGDGNDNVKGGSGDDYLNGEAGSDSVDGGSGYDACPDAFGANRIRNCELP